MFPSSRDIPPRSGGLLATGNIMDNNSDRKG